ncbi:hypothetical protein M8J75_006829 [Diaphorina citri]|nr:hypothetical protein M8J75_006829 [Diaphorina citri]
MLPGICPVVALLVLSFQVNYALELAYCGGALGLENGVIPDKDISASSAHDSSSVGPQFGRLRHDKNGGAWCPKHMVGNDGHEYIEVNLHDLHIVTGVQLQGRFGNGLGQEYAEEIVICDIQTRCASFAEALGKAQQKLEQQDKMLLADVTIVTTENHIRTVWWEK